MKPPTVAKLSLLSLGFAFYIYSLGLDLAYNPNVYLYIQMYIYTRVKSLKGFLGLFLRFFFHI